MSGYTTLVWQAGIMLAAFSLPACAAKTGEEASMQQPSVAGAVLAERTLPVELGTAPVEIELVAAAGRAGLQARLAALAPQQQVYLVLDSLRVGETPGDLYQVELVAAGARKAAVGSFSVFGVSHAGGATSQRSFVVTDALRALAVGEGIVVRLTPGPGAAADARITVGRMALIVQ